MVTFSGSMQYLPELGMSFAFTCPSVLLEAAWRSCSSAEGHPFSSSHVNLGGSPQLEEDIEETCGAGHAKLQIFAQSTLFWFSQRWEAALSYLQKAGVWPNCSYSPSRTPRGGLSVQTLLLALTPMWQTSCRQLVRTWVSTWATGMWCMPTYTHRDTGAVLHGSL